MWRIIVLIVIVGLFGYAVWYNKTEPERRAKRMAKQTAKYQKEIGEALQRAVDRERGVEQQEFIITIRRK